MIKWILALNSGGQNLFITSKYFGISAYTVFLFIIFNYTLFPISYIINLKYYLYSIFQDLFLCKASSTSINERLQS